MVLLYSLSGFERAVGCRTPWSKDQVLRTFVHSEHSMVGWDGSRENCPPIWCPVTNFKLARIWRFFSGCLWVSELGLLNTEQLPKVRSSTKTPHLHEDCPGLPRWTCPLPHSHDTLLISLRNNCHNAILGRNRHLSLVDQNQDQKETMRVFQQSNFSGNTGRVGCA